MKVLFRSKIGLIIFLAMGNVNYLLAQCANQVTHLTGTTIINGISVTVTSSGVALSNTVYCTETFPYSIGINNQNGSYIFTFSPPADSVRLNFSGISYIAGSVDERIVLKKNGVHYPIPQVGTPTICDPLAVLTPEGDIKGCCVVSGWGGTTITGPITSLEVLDSVVLGAPNASIFSLFMPYPCVIPVKFVSCDAKILKDVALITWQTSYEQNNLEYEINRSVDGISFIKIGSIKSNNSALGGNYTFLDTKPFLGINYYRVDSKDLDGKITSCQVNKVKFSSQTKEIKVYPIPTTGILKIENNFKGKNLNIEITDITGKTVLQTKRANSVNTNLSIENLPKGVYTLKIFSEDDVEYRKIVKL